MSAPEPSNRRVLLAIFGSSGLLFGAVVVAVVLFPRGAPVALSLPQATLAGALFGLAALAVVLVSFKLAGLRLTRGASPLILVVGALSGAYYLPQALLGRAAVSPLFDPDAVDFALALVTFLLTLAGAGSAIVGALGRRRR